MRARVFERWVVVGAASFALFFSAALKLAFSHEQLLSQISRGAGVTIQLNADACHDLGSVELGQLSCTAPYIGHYDRRTNAWILRGRTNLNDQVFTNSFKNAPNEPGHVSVWGKLGSFDEAGNVYLFGKVRGSITSAWQNVYR
jgi:hypothetical protein